MIYQFGPYELDVGKVELRAGATLCDVEPQVFALLALLVENRERMVSKDEIIEKVWDGRAVTDAAIASRVKSARRAVGDDGKAQRLIRTIHRQGFRFVATAKALRGTASPGFPEFGSVGVGEQRDAVIPSLDQSSRPSIAVLPFRLLGSGSRYAALAVAVPDELITELSRLRWLLVTARGSSFRLPATDADVTDIGRLLRVRYCLSGTVELSGRELAIAVELVDTGNAAVLWAERFAGSIDDVHAIREAIRRSVLAALELQIPLHEAGLARLRTSENLDAWSAYHLGLQHMYRFNRVDNVAASTLFHRAISLDPFFARAHAGLSFIHFQTAFMRYEDDLSLHSGEARRYAERGLELDPLDPFVNFTMGRAYWLKGDLESSLGWLERATTLSPHYAQGIYARAWTEVLSGRLQESRLNVDLAMRLSPLDPLHYAMLATRAFTHLSGGEDAAAAHWAERAARSPGAHVLIAMIAAAAHILNGDRAWADYWAANVRDRKAALNRHDFCRAFPMKSDALRERVVEALVQLQF